MQHFVRRLNLDTEPTDEPCDIFAHTDGPNWYSVDSPIDTGGGPPKVRENTGDYVHVKLYPYLTRAEPIDAIGFAFQLGLELGKRHPHMTRMTLILGTPIAKTFHPTTGLAVFRIWFGFAFSDPSLKHD